MHSGTDTVQQLRILSDTRNPRQPRKEGNWQIVWPVCELSLVAYKKPTEIQTRACWRQLRRYAVG